jgi:hypothetical protein
MDISQLSFYSVIQILILQEKILIIAIIGLS